MPNKSCASFSNTKAARNWSVMEGTGVSFVTPSTTWFSSSPSFMNEYTRSQPASVLTASSCTKRQPSRLRSAANAGRASTESGRNSVCRPMAHAPFFCAASARDFSSRMPIACTTASMMASGRTAQPGAYTSTGMALSTPPITL